MRQIIIIFIMGLSFSCCKTDISNNTNKPIWERDLESFKWVMEGLDKVVIYNNIAVYSTTFVSDEQIEDNRLCGLDSQTGRILWVYPADTSTTHNNAFVGSGYVYMNRLVFSNKKNNGTSDLVCINIETGKEFWTKTFYGEQYGLYDVGNKQFLYTIGRQQVLVKTDIMTGDTTTIYTPTKETNLPQWIFSMSNTVSDGHLALVQYEYDENDPSSFENYLYFFDIETNIITKKIQIPRLRSYSWSIEAIISNGKVYIDVGGDILCLDINTNAVVWTYIDTSSSRTLRQLYLYDGVLWGIRNQNYVALNANTGTVLHNGTGIDWITYDRGYVYASTVLSSHQIDIIENKTGNKRAIITCPQKRDGDWINSYLRGAIKDDKFYFASYTSAYCYPTYPWN